MPARLQLMLYAGAVLAGFAFTWAASRIDNFWFGLLSFIAIMAVLKVVAAAHLIKNRRAQENAQRNSRAAGAETTPQSSRPPPASLTSAMFCFPVPLSGTKPA